MSTVIRTREECIALRRARGVTAEDDEEGRDRAAALFGTCVAITWQRNCAHSDHDRLLAW